MANIKEQVLEIIASSVTDNEQIARAIRQANPDATTTAASVSSIKSNARKAGELEDLPEVPPNQFASPADLPESEETEEEVYAKLDKRFKTLDRMVDAVIKGVLPSLIISGPAGLGKSWPLRKALANVKEESDQYVDMVSGSISAAGLYEALWNARANGVLLLDDCDDVFKDFEALNLLKAALDSGDRRIISWRKQSHWLDSLGIDNSFEFKGRVIFITNIDFEQRINAGSNNAVHFQALMDRSLYLSIGIRTVLDYMTRIKMIALGEGMLTDQHGLDEEQAVEIVDFVEKNRKRFYHLSLRLVHQIAICFKADPDNWEDDVEVTKMRTT